MNAKAQGAADPLKRIERDQRHLLRIRRILFFVLPIAVLLAAGDLVQWGLALQTVEPKVPNLKPILEPLPTVAPLEFPATLFKPLEPILPEPEKETIVVPQVVWKLKGVILAGTKRAFLEDSKAGRTLWVAEGQSLGRETVKEIRERSVILIRGNETIELRM